ncbi:unnamed protein product [Cylindrotheca closterium]|uniref:Uncharacterized protein n=1 Tax=Cylindrotheca closterium TaxID=2856 RepID=A0AAD2FS24_9STRA|nr:unnamed protein product [Cylindrotheca closterium]CAJ1947006.1 unnamed protein product [Cylindrotheca closterium]CAJ1951162.1 unnamed protein product [Cylindrotheca closterium]
MAWTEEKWERSEAKRALESDLTLGYCPIDPRRMSVKDTWDQLYDSHEEFDGMAFSFFRKQLTALRKKWKDIKKAEWVAQWETSEAKALLEDDLDNEMLPVDAASMSARAAWDERYIGEVEFEFMEFGFFTEKLQAVRKAWKEKKLAEWQKNWDQSEAKRILQDDLDSGFLPIAAKEMSAKDAWEETYSLHGEFAGMNLSFFSRQLAVLRKEAKKKEAIDWKPSAARLIIIYDLADGVLDIDEDRLPARDAWNATYKDLPEFQEVPYWQFEEKLKDHRESQQQSVVQSCKDELTLAHDLSLFHVKTHNDRGELRFCMTDAKKLLREDVARGLHKGITPKQFQSSRKAYHPFKARKFKERIYQEVRYQKFVAYLADKREKKLKEARRKDQEKKEKEEKRKQKQREMELKKEEEKKEKAEKKKQQQREKELKKQEDKKKKEQEKEEQAIAK